MEELKNQPCPVCNKKSCTLREDEKDIPYFGKTFLFSMECTECGFNMSDLESAETKDPIKITFTTENKNDLNVRIIRSSNATINIPTLRTKITPGTDSNGYVSNLEGILQRIKKIIEEQRDIASSTGDKAAKTKAKNLLKKIWKIECGDLPLKIVIQDPSGNSAIISDKAQIEKLKK